MTPMRIQRKRTKGFRLQDASPDGKPVVYVGRPSAYGNPWTPENVHILSPDGKGGVKRTRKTTLQDCVSEFKSWLNEPDLIHFRNIIKKELRNKHLACWCRLCDKHQNGKHMGVECSECEPCHVDPLLLVANK